MNSVESDNVFATTMKAEPLRKRCRILFEYCRKVDSKIADASVDAGGFVCPLCLPQVRLVQALHGQAGPQQYHTTAKMTPCEPTRLTGPGSRCSSYRSAAAAWSAGSPCYSNSNACAYDLKDDKGIPTKMPWLVIAIDARIADAAHGHCPGGHGHAQGRGRAAAASGCSTPLLARQIAKAMFGSARTVCGMYPADVDPGSQEHRGSRPPPPPPRPERLAAARGIVAAACRRHVAHEPRASWRRYLSGAVRLSGGGHCHHPGVTGTPLPDVHPRQEAEADVVGVSRQAARVRWLLRGRPLHIGRRERRSAGARRHGVSSYQFVIPADTTTPPCFGRTPTGVPLGAGENPGT